MLHPRSLLGREDDAETISWTDQFLNHVLRSDSHHPPSPLVKRRVSSCEVLRGPPRHCKRAVLAVSSVNVGSTFWALTGSATLTLWNDDVTFFNWPFLLSRHLLCILLCILRIQRGVERISLVKS